ncbi:alpha-L-fucosidase [Spirillospora sp. CA-108201]
MANVPMPRHTPGDSSWFTNDRFGLFIHWGLYAMGARGEWVQRNEAIPADEYEARYFGRFDPDLYDPVAWADAAANAGMKYVVVVTKHQEGFCLWDTELTDFKAPNTPAGRDLLRPMLDAFRARGLRTGLYYSLIDWHHPDFTVDVLHPLAGAGDWAKLNKGREMDTYREFVKGQIRELLTEYGPVDVMWPDFSYDPASFALMANRSRPSDQPVPDTPFPGDTTRSGKGAADWHSEELLAMIRELAGPDVLVNDRLGLDVGYDITTPEQGVPRTWPRVNGEPALWETCQTFSGAWGYHRDQSTWKSVEQLVLTLVDVVGRGGNLLLNVGPTGRGEFDERVLDRLNGIGEWMRQHSRSIYGCTQAPDDVLTALPPGVRATYNPTTSRLYLHMAQWPAEPLVVPGLRDRVAYAQLLHDGSEVRRPAEKGPAVLHEPEDSALWLGLPTTRPNVLLPVIELFLKN